MTPLRPSVAALLTLVLLVLSAHIPAALAAPKNQGLPGSCERPYRRNPHVNGDFVLGRGFHDINRFRPVILSGKAGHVKTRMNKIPVTTGRRGIASPAMIVDKTQGKSMPLITLF
ncbi:hypothetical protein DFJ73DRAFT_763341 [Zopfochytrium polystomum]|nr:hypothetical protein DFJ73DRAFT_763341 [Zopfochytrium polystomum]